VQAQAGQILLAAATGAGDEEIARRVGVGGSTVYRTKRRFVLGSLAAALSEDPPRSKPQALGQRGIPAGRDRLFEPARAGFGA
jgi:transposase